MPDIGIFTDKKAISRLLGFFLSHGSLKGSKFSLSAFRLSVFHVHSQKGAEFLVADSPGPVMRFAPGTTKSLAPFHFPKRSSHVFGLYSYLFIPSFLCALVTSSNNDEGGQMPST